MNSDYLLYEGKIRMEVMTIQEIIGRQDEPRGTVMRSSDRALSALVLSRLALEHDCVGSYAAAILLIAMERGKTFDFRLLLKLDTENRAHADLVMRGYCAHDLWPSRWLNEIGYDGGGNSEY